VIRYIDFYDEHSDDIHATRYQHFAPENQYAITEYLKKDYRKPLSAREVSEREFKRGIVAALVRDNPPQAVAPQFGHDVP
jgi:hypothetical protein